MQPPETMSLCYSVTCTSTIIMEFINYTISFLQLYIYIRYAEQRKRLEVNCGRAFLSLMFRNISEYSQSVHSLNLLFECLWRTNITVQLSDVQQCYRDNLTSSQAWLTNRESTLWFHFINSFLKI